MSPETVKQLRDLYNQNPNVCKECNKTIDFLLRKYNKFCTRSCAAIYYNRHRKLISLCIQCNNKIQWIKGSKLKFCSCACDQEFRRKERERLFNLGLLNSKRAKLEIIYKFGSKCMECGWDKINPTNGKCPIELEHIDGNSSNNKPENLKLLCPNCHSLTPTYKALNKGKGKISRMQRYREGKSY